MVELAPRINFKALQALLESEDFYCDVAAVSTIPHFYRRLRSHDTVRLLIRFVSESPSNADAVLRYAQDIVLTARGPERSEKGAALCACVVALSSIITPGVEQFLRWLRRSRLLTLGWASDLTEHLASFGAGLTRWDSRPMGYLYLVRTQRAEVSGGSSDTCGPIIRQKVSESQNSRPEPLHLAA